MRTRLLPELLDSINSLLDRAEMRLPLKPGRHQRLRGTSLGGLLRGAVRRRGSPHWGLGIIWQCWLGH